MTKAWTNIDFAKRERLLAYHVLRRQGEVCILNKMQKEVDYTMSDLIELR